MLDIEKRSSQDVLVIPFSNNSETCKWYNIYYKLRSMLRSVNEMSSTVEEKIKDSDKKIEELRKNIAKVGRSGPSALRIEVDAKIARLYQKIENLEVELLKGQV